MPDFPGAGSAVGSRALCVARLRRQRVFRREDYGLAQRDKVTVHLTARSDYYPDGTVSLASLVVADADQLAGEWVGEGIGGRTNAPVDTPWGMREGTYFDPDGNLLRFDSPLPHR